MHDLCSKVGVFLNHPNWYPLCPHQMAITHLSFHLQPTEKCQSLAPLEVVLLRVRYLLINCYISTHFALEIFLIHPLTTDRSSSGKGRVLGTCFEFKRITFSVTRNSVSLNKTLNYSWNLISWSFTYNAAFLCELHFSTAWYMDVNHPHEQLSRTTANTRRWLFPQCRMDTDER